MPDIPKGVGELLESKYNDANNKSTQAGTKKKSFWAKLFGI